MVECDTIFKAYLGVPIFSKGILRGSYPFLGNVLRVPIFETLKTFKKAFK